MASVTLILWSSTRTRCPLSCLRNDLKGDRNWLKVLLAGTKFKPERHRLASHRALRRRKANSNSDSAIQFIL